MSTWFTETPLWAYFLLAVAALVLGFRFYVTREAKYLYSLPALLALAFGFWLIDYMVETDREQVERKTKELADFAEKGNVDRLLDLFSSRFTSTSFASREVLAAEARKYLVPRQDRRIQFWNVTVKSNANQQEISSRCSVQASGQFGPYRDDQPRLGVLDFTFTKDGDGQWRIRHMRVTDVTGAEITLPR